MNNCPKCGNPLQPGISTCPICGTEVGSKPEKEVTQKTVASVASPVPTTVKVEEQQVQNSAQQLAQPGSTETTVTPQVVTVDEPQQSPVLVTASNEQPPVVVQAPVQAVEPQVVVSSDVPQGQEVAQQQTVVQSQISTQPQTVGETQNVIHTQTTVEPQVVPQQQTVTQPQVVPSIQQQTGQVSNGGEQPQPVGQTQVPPAPVISSSGNVSPVPSIPSSLSNQPSVANPGTTKPAETKKEKKAKGSMKINKNVLVIAVAIIAVLGVGAYMFLGGSNTGNVGGGNNTPAQNVLSGNTVSSNGYKFSLAEGWIVTEGNGNVIISNSSTDSATVQIKLSNSATNIENINEEVINRYTGNNEKLKDSKIEKIDVSAKDAYLLNTKINDLPVQVYFIGGGSRLLLGATVVYSSEDSKTKFEATVLEMIGTLSYADDSIKALDVLDMYKDIFSVYNGVVSYSNLMMIDNTSNNENADNTTNVDNNSVSNMDNGQNSNNENVTETEPTNDNSQSTPINPTN